MRKINIENHKRIAENTDPVTDLHIELWMDIVDLLTECGYREDKGWTEDEDEILEKINDKVELIMERFKKFIQG